LIEEVVAPVFHKKLAPLAPDAVRTELPQLSATTIVGTPGTALIVIAAEAVEPHAFV
jgi:hypothetical protein